MFKETRYYEDVKLFKQLLSVDSVAYEDYKFYVNSFRYNILNTYRLLDKVVDKVAFIATLSLCTFEVYNDEIIFTYLPSTREVCEAARYFYKVFNKKKPVKITFLVDNEYSSEMLFKKNGL